jgi:hypothetical protein
MKEGSFEGMSENGLIQEALNNAIEIAKETLKTDLIKWKLEEMSGEDGGFIQKHFLSIKIHAQSPPF